MGHRYSRYNFKFYLNASHAIYLDGRLGQSHPHTWEIALETVKISEDFVQFDRVEKMIEKYLSSYQDKDLNKMAPFDAINPTLERICQFFKDQMGQLLAKEGWALVKIEISETPSRAYIIDMSDEYPMTPSDDISMPIDTPATQKTSLEIEANRLLDDILKE